MSIPDFFLCSFYDLMVIIEAHRKNEHKQWYHTRMIAYCNMTASWNNPKRRPPSIDRYMRLEDNSHDDEFVESQLKILHKAKEEYNKKVSLKKEDIN